jgi:hypothetical protein
LYEPLADTVAVPTVFPPEEQSDGADDCGPNTVNVIVPPGEPPPDSAADTPDAEIAVPTVPDDGALTDIDVVAAVTAVSAIPAPHVESDPAFVPSPS